MHGNREGYGSVILHNERVPINNSFEASHNQFIHFMENEKKALHPGPMRKKIHRFSTPLRRKAASYKFGRSDYAVQRSYVIGSRTWTCRSALPRSRLNTEEQSRKNHGTPECCATALSRHEHAWYVLLVLNSLGHGESSSMTLRRFRMLGVHFLVQDYCTAGRLSEWHVHQFSHQSADTFSGKRVWRQCRYHD